MDDSDRCSAPTQSGEGPIASPSDTFLKMVESDDRWTGWIHPVTTGEHGGYRMKCCDCGLVHLVQYQIAEANDEPEEFLSPGEGPDTGVIVFRVSRFDRADVEHPLRRGSLAMAMLCAWNNISPDQAPPEWAEHPSHESRIAWERVAATARAYLTQEGWAQGGG